MWVFCRDGFFSAVEHRDNHSMVMIRARLEGDLERMLKRIGADSAVEETPEADYRFRTVITKKQWAKFCEMTGEEIDYANFKNSVHEKDSDIRNQAYMDCWAAMNNAQWEQIQQKKGIK